MIKTIFFDIDDTLVNHKLANEAAISWAHKAFFPSKDLTEFISLWKQTSQKYWQQFEDGLITIDQQRIKRFQDIWLYFNQDIPEESAFKLYQNFLIHYEENWQLFDHASSVLTTLTKRKIPLGIITNGSETQQYKKLTNTGIIDFFTRPLIVISEALGISKPNPKIFKHAQKQARVKPTEILYIGDKIDADMEIPHQLGWQVALIDHHNQYQKTNPFPLLTSLDQVLAIVT